MKLLTATTETQGHRASDFNWLTDGELVTHDVLTCDRDRDEGPDGGCGCGRAFGGLTSLKSGTTAIVTDIADFTIDDLKQAIRSWHAQTALGEDDRSECDKERRASAEAETLAALAGRYPAGTVLERRLFTVQARGSDTSGDEHTTGPEYDHDRWQIRRVGYYTEDDGGHVSITVDHVSLPGTCAHGDHDSGRVGLVVRYFGDEVTMIIKAEDAVMLANRITRAAELVLESSEDLPDPEREYRRHSRGGA